MQKRQSRGRLGEFLIVSGHLSASDLEHALEIQRVAGGHLGTNLLEMGVIEEDVLLDAIGKLHENPTVSGKRLIGIPTEVSLKVPRELVRRHGIVPFALHGNTVYIASQRPGDIHIENEVTLATSRLTRTFIGLEVRVQEALHAHHGHSLPLRFSRLAANLDGTSGKLKTTSSLQPPRTVEAATENRDGWISSSEEFDPTLEGSVGKKIAWEDFEDTEKGGNEDSNGKLAEKLTAEPIELLSTSDSSATDLSSLGITPTDPIFPETTSTTSKTTEPLSTGSAATEQPATPRSTTASPTLRAGGAPTSSSTGLSAPDAPAEGTQEVAASPSSVTQFPFAVRAKRKRNLDTRFSGLHLPTDQKATVEQEELQLVSSSSGASAGHLADAHAALLEAPNRDAVARIVMETLRPFFSRRLLLAKRGDQLRGWLADGPGVRPNKLIGLGFPLASGTPFLSIQKGSRFWLGAYHQDAAYQHMGAILGPVRPPDCMVLPLRAGQHIVAYLYGDNERSTVTGQPLSEFLELTDAAGAAFERIIRRIRDNRDAPTLTSETSVKEISTRGRRTEASGTDPWR